MSSALQIITGAAMLLVCAALHLYFAARTVDWLKRRGLMEPGSGIRPHFATTSGVFLVFLGSHTLQIYLWAFCLMILGALARFSDAIYFSLVTYTTLGYGDITLSPDFRIFGSMASVTGILMFGLTTAFLVGIISRLTGDE